jgi:hypothetical protein
VNSPLAPKAWVFVAALLLGCAAPSTPPAGPVERQPGREVHFEFRGPDAAVFDSKGTRGRVTLVALITTYDIGSQLLVRRLDDLLRNYVPRVNVGAVAMEAPRYAELVRIFPNSLGLRFPVVMADPASLSGAGPFGVIERIPTLVVLDAEGRLVRRLEGVPEMSEIRAAVASAGRAR